ncbi:MAG: hypothetical protein Tsb002_01100 [Wenzhouxiangellaceae bacterium]
MQQKTLAERFIQKAKELLPQYIDDLVDLDPAIDTAGAIDDIMFRKGEYLGGMAACILAILAKEGDQ